jgi:hypothetical protein
LRLAPLKRYLAHRMTSLRLSLLWPTKPTARGSFLCLYEI